MGRKRKKKKRKKKRGHFKKTRGKKIFEVKVHLGYETDENKPVTNQ